MLAVKNRRRRVSAANELMQTQIDNGLTDNDGGKSKKTGLASEIK
jgi:hypothetical protein